MKIRDGIKAGQRYGRLTIVEKVVARRYDQWQWRCACDCGGEVTLRGSLIGKSNFSCGCFRRDRCGQLYRKHGKSKTAEYCMFYDARKRAVSLGIPFSITPDDIVIPDICPILGIKLQASGARDSRPSLDRIIPALGYTTSNICVISFRANRIKSDASAAELKAILAYVERL